jgi:hypothetical protein
MITPQTTANRPGLPALAYRAGVHATFLETMKAHLASHTYSTLSGLTTRDTGDPTIALMDAWATVADVLTFYQERIANEGYLRTATERRSIQELARLVGYTLRPGVAASVFLAFELEKESSVEIPVGTRAQSLPGPGELPQPFETSVPLPAHTAWNALKPRMTQPQRIDKASRTAYLKGTAVNLAPNAPLLIDFGDERRLYRLVTVEPDPAADRTRVTYRPWLEPVQDQALTATPPPTASGPTMLLPDALHAANLHALTHAMAEIGQMDAKEIQALIEQFGAVLLSVFEILTDTPRTPEHHRTIDRAIKALESLAKIAQTMIDHINNSLIQQRLQQLLDWINAALDVLNRSPTAPIGIHTTQSLHNLTELLTTPPPVSSLPPKDPTHLRQDPRRVFSDRLDIRAKLMITLKDMSGALLYDAWRNTTSPHDHPGEVYALRTTASLFGHNAPKEPQYEPQQIPGTEGIMMENPKAGNLTPQSTWEDWEPTEDEDGKVFLDGAYETIAAGSYTVIQYPSPDSDTGFDLSYWTVQHAMIRSRSAYGLSAKTTVLVPQDGETWKPATFEVIRGTTVYAHSENLDLAEEPLDTEEHPDAVEGEHIQLDGLFDGLEAGRWLIVTGERTDLPGVTWAEVVMVAGVEHILDESLPGDRLHTTLHLDNALAHAYTRETVTIYGNVVKATHGETREEVLGSGDGSRAMQRFTLKHAPLTYLAASNPSGIESTLEVRVNDVRWHEVARLVERGRNDRVYVTETDDEARTTVIFGDGHHGTRLPTGVENVKAVYRTGIGNAGNVDARRISLLATRPLGVKGVTNPKTATGGADRESRDQARRNVPVGVMALDRLVSIRDYADFCRAFAGIGKASATRLSSGRRTMVYITLAGAEDAPIDKMSDLYRNLLRALRRYGDPYLPIQVELREMMILVISANVRLEPDYLWEAVSPEIRAALLAALGFEQRSLGQDVRLSEVISVIHHVPGVAYVDVDLLDSVSESDTRTTEHLAAKLEDLAAAQPHPKHRIEVHMAGYRDDDTYHVIQEGDTWEGVAELYATTAEELRRLNHLADTQLDPPELGIPRLIVRREILLKPAQIACLTPDVPETLILTELI